MKVLKFGGSSVGSPEQIMQVKKIIDSQQESCVVVVSAFQGITDQLVNLATLAMQHNEAYKKEVVLIEQRHLDTINEIIEASMRPKVTAQIHTLIKSLNDILTGVLLLGELTPKIQDLILSFGEQLSATIISNVVKKGVMYDARKFIRTNSNYGSARVDFTLTDNLILQYFQLIDHIPVIPGFIASNDAEETTTLGRGGSDYTAAILAATLNASSLEIWTDVDGFMTADPRKVAKAYAINSLTYAESIELSHFGAKVIYTPTIHPVYKKNIPIAIRNTFNPSAKGTIISNLPADDNPSLIKGISSIDDICIVSIQGAGMVGVTGVSMRIFRALAKSKTNVMLITQASSEFSISIAITPEDSLKAKEALEEEFQTEIYLRNELKVTVENDLSVIAIVGEKMKNTPGISANLFNSLARNGVSVIATAQGSSEINISVAIRKEDLRKALNAIHEGFFLSHFRELNLYLIGLGNVGSSLLKQINQQQVKLEDELRLKINLVGIANSRKMYISSDSIDPSSFHKALDTQGESFHLDSFVNKMVNQNLRNSVLIDCTANEHVTTCYSKAFDSYISVVTANKIACSGEYEQYRQLKEKAKKKGVRFMYETNVGAGLPIINTINDLIRSGDKILRIEAVVSGTLNFIFSTISATVPMSKAIRMAKEKGYSEPDPRIDLSGLDVMRKLLILARESGYTLEKENVNISSFLPAECFEGPIENFWTSVEKLDASFETQRVALEKENKKWRFVATLDRGKASIGLIAIDDKHPFYQLEGSNNIIVLTSERYNELPMIIKGYGAGNDVTAAGVFADIIRVANV